MGVLWIMGGGFRVHGFAELAIKPKQSQILVKTCMSILTRKNRECSFFSSLFI